MNVQNTHANMCQQTLKKNKIKKSHMDENLAVLSLTLAIGLDYCSAISHPL